MGRNSPSLNPAITNMAAPRIPEAQAWATAYDGSKGPLIDLSQAVPGYPPPPEMLKWLGETSASTDAIGYGRIEGEPVLREAYALHVAGLYKTSLESSHVHITSGCNQAFMVALMAVAGASDTVLLTNPNYFNHDTTLSMMGISTKTVACLPENHFLPKIEDLKPALEGVKAFALVSPNNPTGTVYPAQLLREIFDVCQEAGVWLIVDETYRDFMDPTLFHDLLSRPRWEETFIQLYSFSKSFCIPGHRLGAVLAGPIIVDAVSKIMDNLQICAPRAAQQAVAKAIEPLTNWREENRREILRRSEALQSGFARLNGWHIDAIGAYFAYVRHPYSDMSSDEVAKKLALRDGISCLPGSYFGSRQEGYLRVAFANVDTDSIEQLIHRLAGDE